MSAAAHPPLKCTREFCAEWRVATLYSTHPDQAGLDGADNVLHDAEIAHDILARAEVAETTVRQRDATIGALLAVLKKLRRGDLHQRVRPLYDEAQKAIAEATK